MRKAGVEVTRKDAEMRKRGSKTHEPKGELKELLVELVVLARRSLPRRFRF
jgi:hypothetical protein